MNDMTNPSAGAELSTPISFADRAVQQCPYAAYDKLREEAPVYRDPVTGNYVLTRYDDVRKAAIKPKPFSSKTGLGQTREGASDATNAIYEERGYLPIDTMLSNDPPSHRFYRQLVDKAFISSKVEEMEPRIRDLVTMLLDRMIDKPEVDFVEAFAAKLPIYVMGEELNIAEEDISKLKLWADVSIESQDPTMTFEREIEVAHTIADMQEYMARSVNQVRARPDGGLLSRVVHAELDGRQLDMRELMSITQQLITGGTDTTVAALGGGLKLMIDNPEVQDELRSSPELIKKFVEETLRLAAPLQTMFRRTTEDVEIRGVAIPAGSVIEVRYGSANRDPAVFECPAQLDLQRTNSHTHLAFGAGPHICIGNQLARAELRIAFEEILRRMANIRYAQGSDSYTFTDLYISNGLTKLLINFEKQ